MLFPSTANAETAAKTAEQIVKDDYWNVLHTDNKSKDGNDTLVAMELGGEKDDGAGGTRPYTCAEIADQWTAAIGKATASTYVYVKLMQDWAAAAPSDGARPVFGTASGNNGGFCDTQAAGAGALLIGGKKVIFDLNGYVLDRNLTGGAENGSAIFVNGSAADLVVVDSNPTRAHAETVQEEIGEERLKYSYSYEDETTGEAVAVPVTGGIITGGNAKDSNGTIAHGGGIRIYAGSLHLRGGTIFGNGASQQGGGVQANGNNAAVEKIVVDGGNIIGNNATSGGGIYAYNGAYVTVKSGHIYANTAISGGGINSSSTVTVSGGEIMYNTARGGNGSGNQGGGIYLSSTGKAYVSGGKISNNTAYFMGGGIYAEKQANNTAIAVYVSGGELTQNYASYAGGGMYVAAGVNLSGGVISDNDAGRGEGIYFHDGDGALIYKLELAGPVILKDNGSYASVSNNLHGNVILSVTGDLKSGEGESLKKAEIYISDSFCPIAGYNENGHNYDGDNVPVSPAEYFRFTYTTPDPGEVIIDNDGQIVYSIPFKTHYFTSDDGRYYNNDIGLTDAQYGTKFLYGTYGEHGIAVKVVGDDETLSNKSFIYFDKYAYDPDKETAVEEQLGDVVDYDVDELTEVGIYIGSGTVYVSGGNSQSITVRVIISPRPIGETWVDYDKADKTFNGEEIKPDVYGVAVPEPTNPGEDKWFENPLTADTHYTVSYENNVHVAGDNYVVVTGKGNYGGVVKLPFNIVQPEGHTYAESGAAETVWQIYKGNDWKTVSESEALVYNDSDQKFNVRALVSSKLGAEDYTSYVYAEGAKEADYKLAAGEDKGKVDPGLKLVFKKNSEPSMLFDADTYTVTVAENGEDGGDFALPEQDIAVDDFKVDPFEITEAEMAEASAEKDDGMLVVKVGTEYIPFLSSVSYIENDEIKTGSGKFAYVLYNGKTQTIVFNPDFTINLPLFSRDFSAYIVSDPEISHSVTLAGAVNADTTVTTSVKFTLNGNFKYKDDNSVTLTKTWHIVTKSNSLTLGAVPSEVTYGDFSSIAVVSQAQADNDTFVEIAKQGASVAKVVVAPDGSLYAYSETAEGKRGAAIDGTLKDYVSGKMFESGVGSYTVTVSAPQYVSTVADENAAIYYAAPKSANFTVAPRSVADGGDITVAVNDDGIVYTGESAEAEVSLAYGDRTLVKDTDFVLAFENNVHAGNTAKVTISGKGNYSGCVVKNFTIAKATDNIWTTSLNLASWVTGSFNSNISVLKGATKYGSDSLVFAVTVPAELAEKVSAEDVEELKALTVEDGVIGAKDAEALKRLPVGKYTLTATMDSSDDYNTLSGTFEFDVLAAVYSAPALNEIGNGDYQNISYSGSVLSMSIKGYDSAVMKVTSSDGVYFDTEGGTAYATDAGTYTIRLSLNNDECTWADGTREDKVLTWTVKPKVVKAPEPPKGRFIVNGNVQTYMPEGFDPSLMRIENNERSEAGDSSVTVYLLDSKNYVWDDGTTGARVFTWTIDDADWIFYTVIGVIFGCAFIGLVFMLTQYLKHRARMKDLAEADKKNSEGGNE